MQDMPTHSLVSSSDVVGTEVYSPGQDHIGSIDHVMIDKQSGKVAYAVMSFGGILGMGAQHYPLPWAALRYDVAQGGFVTDVTPEQLQAAPTFDDGGYGSRDWEIRTHDTYGVPYYWI